MSVVLKMGSTNQHCVCVERRCEQLSHATCIRDSQPLVNVRPETAEGGVVSRVGDGVDDQHSACVAWCCKELAHIVCQHDTVPLRTAEPKASEGCRVQHLRHPSDSRGVCPLVCRQVDGVLPVHSQELSHRRRQNDKKNLNPRQNALAVSSRVPQR
jgi:hypothetical protein